MSKRPGSPSSRVRRSLAACGIALLGLALLPAAAAAGAGRPAGAPAGRPAPRVHGFERVGHAAVLPRHATALGALPSGAPLSFDVVLQPRDASGLTRFAAAVSNPRSPFYRHYFAPRDVAALFAPPAGEVALVEAQLRGEGLTVGRTGDFGLVLPVRGTAATVAAAFRTGLVGVRLPDGTIGRMATSAPAMPTPIAPMVAGVVGLDVLGRPRPLDMHRRSVATPETLRVGAPATTGRAGEGSAAAGGGPGACSEARSVAQALGGYTPDQIAHSYGLDNLYTSGNLAGGQAVDIFELDPFEMSDIATFDRCIFGADHTSQVSVVPVDGGIAPGFGAGEAALDVEEVSALAPSASINVYEAPGSFASWLDEIAAIVSQDRAPVVSMSYGLCEAQMAALAPGLEQIENVLFEQATLEGQSWFVSSGDSGSETCFRDDFTNESLSVSDPASQPFVTSVGGTTLLVPNDPPTEVVWNDGGTTFQSAGAGGGGISALWPMPSWQSGLAVPGVQGPYTSGAPCSAPAGVVCRENPDVSANADELHGDVVVIGGFYGTIGGTSASAPKWAAIAAMTNATCAAEHVAPVGFVDPALYQVASNPTTDAEAFNDVTVGNDDMLSVHGGAYPATAGYDMATGLGTPRVSSPTGGTGLAALLCSDGSALSPRPTVTGVSPSFGPYEGGTAVTITGSDLVGVTAVNFGTSVVPVTPGDVNGAGTQINVVTPSSPLDPAVAGAPVGGVLVTVGGSAGTSQPSPVAEFHFVAESAPATAVPSVSYVGPSAGNSAGGEAALVVGSGFQEGPYTTGTKPTVSFGGVVVPQSSETVVSDSELSVVVPAESGSTACATAPAVDPSEICQVEVTVGNANGTSAMAPILPPASGSLTLPPPPGTELVAAPTEFDYAPTPTIAGVSPNYLPEQVSGFAPPPIVTIDGSGFDFLTLQAINWGQPGSDYASQFFFLVSIKPTEMQVQYLGLDSFLNASSFPVSVSTAGGTSNAVTVQVAQVPELTSIDVHSGPTTGGTTVTGTGSGFAELQGVEFLPFGFPSTGTTTFTVNSPTSVTFTTPPTSAGQGFFAACNAAGCSFDLTPAVAFTYFEPIPPVVTSVSSLSGPAGGGGAVVITGTGLGQVQSVKFGNEVSPFFGNASQPFAPPTDTQVFAQIPPGPAGKSVPIVVTTFVGTATAPALFRYVASPPAPPDLVIATPARGAIQVLWTASASDGGSRLLGYLVTATPKSGQPVSVGVGPGDLHVLIAPLRAGIRYAVTVSAVSALGKGTQDGPTVLVAAPGDNGYLVTSSDGLVASFGALAGDPAGLAGRTLPGAIVGVAGSPTARGYWLAGADGSVYPIGSVPSFGSLAGHRPAAPVVGIAATPDDRGYWLVARDGEVFGFGDAGSFGSLRGRRLAHPIVGMAVAPGGLGYWLVASDGGVFTFGRAKFLGSLGGHRLAAPIVSTIADPAATGYWLVGADGGVFAFGSAKYHGSLAGRSLRSPVTAALATPDGSGYWLLARDGAVYALGSARYEGGAQGLFGSPAGGLGF